LDTIKASFFTGVPLAGQNNFSIIGFQVKLIIAVAALANYKFSHSAYFFFKGHKGKAACPLQPTVVP
jgi:hypothetical protein